MRIKWNRAITPIMTLALVLASLVGPAQGKVGGKDESPLDQAGPVTLQSVQVSADASRIEITADKPLTYIFYKVSEPAKVVIDLAQTDPGGVKSPIVVGTGNLKRINVNRHAFGDGYLSRVELELSAETEFSVNADPTDRSKIVVSFGAQKTTPPATAEVLQKGVPETAAAVVPVVETKPAPETPAPAPELKADSTPPLEKETPAVTSRARTLSSVKAGTDGVEIAVAGGVETFKAFRLNKPDRIIVDIYDAKNGITNNTIPLRSLGLSQARVGVSGGKVRIVFDAIKGTLPPYEVLRTDAGLKIVFGERKTEAPVSQAVAAPVESKPEVKQEANPEPASEKKTVAEAPTAKSEPTKAKAKAKSGEVEAIDFRVIDGISQIAITTSVECIAGKPVKSAKGVTLTLKNCRIPANLQRVLDTHAFASVVTSVTPYQTKVKGMNEARLLAKLRDKAPSILRQEGQTIYWEIENTVVPEQAAAGPDLSSREAMAEASRVLAAPPPAPEPLPIEIIGSPVSPKGTQKVYTGRKVSLEFSDADIRKIFQLIAEVSNLNFLIGDDVTGTISLKLVNVPWDQALDVILESKQLAMKRDGNIIQIRPKSKMQSQDEEESAAKLAREKGMDLLTAVFDINFAAVSDIVSQFNGLKSSRGIITKDDRTNRVIVKDIAPAIDEMRLLLKNLDIPERQVMIEARIVEASSTFTRDLGIQWTTKYKDGDASILGINSLTTSFGGIVSPVLPTDKTGGAVAGISFGKLTSNIQVDMRLSAAATIGQIKIISTPKVVTLNNKAAKIAQGQSIPYQTISAEGTKTEFIEAALTLEVTPHITSDGTVSMKIKATNNTAGVGSPPPINKKEATTELVVKNGETTVIGGIFVDQDNESDTGVPFLMDIPLLGWLFKSNTKTKIKTELLIFITPKVVS